LWYASPRAFRMQPSGSSTPPRTPVTTGPDASRPGALRGEEGFGPFDPLEPADVSSRMQQSPAGAFDLRGAGSALQQSRTARLMSVNLRKALAEIVDTKPSSGALRLLEEIHSANRRLRALVAFVPFLGPWLVGRLDGMRGQDRAKLMRLSVGISAAVALGIVAIPVLERLSSGTLRERLDSEIRVLGNIAETYKVEHEAYPSGQVWQGSVQQTDPRFFDPWGRPYLYHSADGHITIGTFGHDGVEGGSGDDADFFATSP